MNRNIWLAAGAVVVIAIAGTAYWQTRGRSDSMPAPVAAAGTPSGAAPAPLAASPAATPEAIAPRREGDDMVMGLASASVTLIEYASLTCPHCAHFQEATFPQFKERYVDTGLVKYIYRDFPLDRIALYGSMLARCTGAPDKFFAFVDVLFRQQNSWIQGNDEGQIITNLKRLARLGGVSDATADTCLRDQAIQTAVLTQADQGSKQFKVNSTPTLVINNKAYPGALEMNELDAILRPLLGRS